MADKTPIEELREGVKKILTSKGYGYNWETSEDTMVRINRIKTDQIIHLLKSYYIEKGKQMERERIVKILADIDSVCLDKEDHCGYCETYTSCEDCIRAALKGGKDER